MTRRPRRDRPPHLPDRPPDPAPKERGPAEPPTPARLLTRAGVCGPHPHLGRDEVLAAARRVSGPGGFSLPPGREAATLDEVRAALVAVAGPQPGSRAVIDPERALEGAVRAGARLGRVALFGGQVALATAAPASLLSVHEAVGRAVRGAGAAVLTGTAAGPYRTGRSLWWQDGIVAVGTDGRVLYDERDPAAGDEWLFTVGRPTVVVADGVFARQAIAAGVETIAFADLDEPTAAVAAYRGCPVAVVPMALRRPPDAYAPLLEALVGALERAATATGLVAPGGDPTRQRPHLATETPGPYAAPPGGGEG